MKNLQFIILISFAFLFSNCKTDDKQTSTQTTATTPAPTANQRPIPKFDANSAYQFVEKQVEFGPRVIGTKASKDCKDWLVAQFKSFGADVIEQNFEATVYTGETFDCTNIIAQINPDKKERVVLGAHWDTRHIADNDKDKKNHTKPVMGADDGGSGVGVLLEIAKQIQQAGIDIGVDIVLFDAEDYGDNTVKDGSKDTSTSWAIGSRYWAQNLHKTGYKANYGILLDMVGAKNAKFTFEGYSMQNAPVLTKKVWQLAKNMGKGNYFVQEKGNPITDDHVNVMKYANIPMIDIINLPGDGRNSQFGEHWHTAHDDMSIIDKRTLGAVGQVVLAVLYRQSNGSFL